MRYPACWFSLILCFATVATTPAAEPPDVPAFKKNKDGTPDQRFIKRHESFAAIAKKGGVDLLLMGDFLTDDWRGNNKNGVAAIYAKAFGNYRPANFGQGGDYTQHVLWRLQNGELDGLTPKVMMLMIGGTNGSNGDRPEAIAAGIRAILETVKRKFPGTRILLLSVIPWGETPGSRRDRHGAVNPLLPQFDDGGKTVKYLDIAGKFLAADGTIPKDIMPDAAHLSDHGYQIWADAVTPALAELMSAKQ